MFCNEMKMKWNESGFRPPLCTYRLNWARRTSWGWWDDWDDTVLQTQDSKFEPWRSEAEHATSRSRRLPTMLTMFCNNITIMLTGQNIYGRILMIYMRAIRIINQWCWAMSTTFVFSKLSNLSEKVCVKPENGIQLSPILRHAAEVEGYYLSHKIWEFPTGICLKGHAQV